MLLFSSFKSYASFVLAIILLQVHGLKTNLKSSRGIQTHFSSGSPDNVTVLAFGGLWERAYMLELFPQPFYYIIYETESRFLENYVQAQSQHKNLSTKIPRAIIYTIGFATSSGRYDSVALAIKLFRPAVLVSLSDEYVGTHNVNPAILYDEVRSIVSE